MRVLATMANQIVILFIWAYFTHHFLVPKEKGWRRELIMFPVWVLVTYITATVLYTEILFKTFSMPVFYFLSFCYMYQWNPKRFIFAIILIYISATLTDIVGAFLIVVCLNKNLVDINYIETLALMPVCMIISTLFFNWILKKSNHINKISNIVLLFLFSQWILCLLVTMNILSTYQSTILYPLILYVLSFIVFQIQLWKSRDQIFLDQKTKILHRQLQSMYQKELETYLHIKDESQMYHTIRHDLFNEIQIISYMEKQES